ncbi:NAD(P)H-binding protein [Rhodococcus sp. H29-C3]|uniref:SDR family oxidoreductase n=1 Tax=Rhodococcus sp. H29-C3 TaxID=3046307 RepID=UPI0024BA8595|nr:NAD(P)H-binding protein [Rhodococcus sp. H29-C3]MDJ0363419.1 NAD(P)H-binding protein [Rhodococcus sp. H29-C3]
MKILVTGATGRVGRQLVEELAGHEVIATTSKQTPPDVVDGRRWLQADLSDPTPWPRLIQNCDAAFLFPAFGHTQAFIDAAARVGLPKLVLLSSGAVSDQEQSFIKAIHSEIEHSARSSGTPTITIRPTVFMSNDLQWVQAIRAQEPVRVAFPEAAMPAIAEHDVAAAIATCLTHDAGTDVFEVTGPRTLTQIDRLEILAEKYTSRRVPWTDITDEARTNGYPGMPGPPGDYLLRNLADAAATPVPSTDVFEQLVGRPGLDYADWVALQ